MFKFLKSLFGKKEQDAVVAPYKVETPVNTQITDAVTQMAQPVTEVTVDPVAVALDLEPVVISVQPAKTPKKPRGPKSAKTKNARPSLEKLAPTPTRTRKPKTPT
jgi:hypothetical protein